MLIVLIMVLDKDERESSLNESDLLCAITIFFLRSAKTFPINVKGIMPGGNVVYNMEVCVCFKSRRSTSIRAKALSHALR